MKPRILVILGPTATGKSDLAVFLAQELNGEVVSADSRQVYKGLDIGTGKITSEEMKGIPHHMLDVTDPMERFSVVEYVKQADVAIQDIISRGKLPIVCGGTGFYIEALVDGKILPEVPANETLRRELGELSLQQLMSRLENADPLRAAEIDPMNKRRIIRAIEIAETLGKVPPVISDPKYQPVFVGLNLDRGTFIEKINTRLISRIHSGMIEEAKTLNTQGLTYERMEELGLEYRYLAKFLQGEMTEDEMIRKLETEIWHYAKRQMTWFKRDERIKWFYPEEREAILDFASKNIISAHR